MWQIREKARRKDARVPCTDAWSEQVNYTFVLKGRMLRTGLGL
jgi:hypothetical protein